MVCYRRHGHNEGDDPKFTQPRLYSIIEKHLNPRENYVSLLQADDTPEIKTLASDMEKKFWSDLQERLDEVKQHPLPYHYQPPELVWKSLKKAVSKDFDQSPDISNFKKTIHHSLRSYHDDPQRVQAIEEDRKIVAG